MDQLHEELKAPYSDDSDDDDVSGENDDDSNNAIGAEDISPDQKVWTHLTVSVLFSNLPNFMHNTYSRIHYLLKLSLWNCKQQCYEFISVVTNPET